MFIGHKCTQNNQEIKIKIEEISLISANLTEISIGLHIYFLKIEEISIKLHKEPSYFMEVNNGKPLRRIMGITQEVAKTVTMSQA